MRSPAISISCPTPSHNQQNSDCNYYNLEYLLIAAQVSYISMGCLSKQRMSSKLVIFVASVMSLISFFGTFLSLQMSFLIDKSNPTKTDSNPPPLQSQKGNAIINSSQRRTITNHHRRLEFVHIPSASRGTFMEAAASRIGIPWGICKFIRPTLEYNMTNIQFKCPPLDKIDARQYAPPPTQPSCPIWQWHIHHFHKNNSSKNPYHNADTFVLISNPYARMIQFYLLAGRRLLRDISYEDLTKEHMNHFLQMELKAKQEIASSCSAGSGGWLVPQVNYVFENGGEKKVVNYTLKMETLRDTFPKLMKKYGLQPITLPDDELFWGKDLFTAKDLDITTIRRIEELYAKDFTALDYPIQSQIRKDTPPSLTETHPPRLEFVHIPKTGGTIIESIAAKAGIRWSICHFTPPRTAAEISENNTLCPGLAPWTLLYGQTIHTCPHWHLPPQYFELSIFPNNPYQNAKLFCVVRNPYDRFISEFFYVQQYVVEKEKQGKNLTAAYLNQWITKLLGFVRHGTKGDISKNITGSREYFISAGHYIPQYDYVYEGSRKVIHHVLKFERLQEDFQELMAMYKLNLTLPPISRDHVRKTIKNLGVKDLSPDVVQLIETMYHDDFRAFGYERISGMSNNSYP